MFPSSPALSLAHFHNNNLVDDANVTAQDVLLGRGASADRFEGNVKFRALVRQHKDVYQDASHHHDKATIAQQVVHAVHAYHGRFLRKLENGGSIGGADAAGAAGATGFINKVVWEIVDNSVAVEKVKQALRDLQQGEAKANKKPAAARSTSGGSDPSGANSSRTSGTPQASGGHGSKGKQKKTGDGAKIKKQSGSDNKALQDNRRPSKHEERAVVAETPAVGTVTANAPMMSVAASQGEAANLAMSRHVHGYLERNAQLQAQRTFHHAVLPHQFGMNGGLAMPMAAATAAGNSLLPATPLLNERIRNEVAFSWREIPGAYLDFLPLVREGRILPFCGEDLQILLLTMAWAEAARDMHCLGLIRMVTNMILELPQGQLRLAGDEIECLISAARRGL